MRLVLNEFFFVWFLMRRTSVNFKRFFVVLFCYNCVVCFQPSHAVPLHEVKIHCDNVIYEEIYIAFFSYWKRFAFERGERKN